MGIHIQGDPLALLDQVARSTTELGLRDSIEITTQPFGLQLTLRLGVAKAWMPGYDTSNLQRHCSQDADHPLAQLEHEIWVAMLGAPTAFDFPNYAEFLSSVRIRRNIAIAARKTQVAFHTTDLERPWDYWAYHEDTGFTVLPHRALTDALTMATQPDQSAHLYAFSCYRASEYVVLLGIAQELEVSNPALLARIQARCSRRAIKSAEFHDTFLCEYGAMDDPVPSNYNVPGDRLWFRNPDPHSSDVSGYEGSWVIYLGGGQFSNFWKRGSPFTLPHKCAELFHWRHATYTDAHGELRVNETLVDELTRATLADPDALSQIVKHMARLRDPPGVYASGGMLDASREFARRVCPDSADMRLCHLK